MNVSSIHNRILDCVRDTVRNGLLTESHLARLTDVSQSHLHNVLKGKRSLSTELADKFLRQMNLNVEEMVKTAALTAVSPFRSVPLLLGALGVAMASFLPERTLGIACVPAHIVQISQLAVAALLGEDPRMAPRFAPGDLIVLDRSAAGRKRITDTDTYVVMTAAGPRLRYLRVGGARFYLPSEDCLRRPSDWESVPLAEASLLDVVQGRVIWVSRLMRTRAQI